jgi:hypothetical protein
MMAGLDCIDRRQFSPHEKRRSFIVAKSKSFTDSGKDKAAAKQHPRIRYNLYIGRINCREVSNYPKE